MTKRNAIFFAPFYDYEFSKEIMGKTFKEPIIFGSERNN